MSKKRKPLPHQAITINNGERRKPGRRLTKEVDPTKRRAVEEHQHRIKERWWEL